MDNQSGVNNDSEMRSQQPAPTPSGKEQQRVEGATQEPAEEKKVEEVKTIWLVRHAESTNNVSKSTAKNTILKGKWPSWQQWKTMAPMITFPMNTPLSSEGVEQVKRQAEKIRRDDFIAKEGIELVVHSHLRRAKETCLGIFGASGVPIEEHPNLYEKSLGEHFSQSTGLGSDITPRVNGFTRWLEERQETKIVLVSHHGFFRNLARPDAPVENVAVWRATLTKEGEYRDVQIVYEGNPPAPNNDHRFPL